MILILTYLNPYNSTKVIKPWCFTGISSSISPKDKPSIIRFQPNNLITLISGSACHAIYHVYILQMSDTTFLKLQRLDAAASLQEGDSTVNIAIFDCNVKCLATLIWIGLVPPNLTQLLLYNIGNWFTGLSRLKIVT